MTFKDLPPAWNTLSLDDPGLVADVLDLLVSVRDRMRGALLLLICDAEKRLVQPVLIEEIDLVPPADSIQMLRPLVVTVADARPDATLLAALARPGRLRVARSDELWAACVQDAVGDTLDLLGVHLITPQGSVPIELTAAA